MTADRELIVLVGPTASGKTAAAIEICEKLRGEIVSADSMQVYRHMDVGTAKPTLEERSRAPFHLIDFVEPDCQITVSDWKLRAEAAIQEIRSRGNIPIVSGGTGLYVKALLDNWTLAAAPRNSEVRVSLAADAAEYGAQALHAKLAEVDPVTAGRLHPNDNIRIVRALEVYHTTGIRISELQARDRADFQPRAATRFGLTMPRPLLYERIDRRVDAMIEAGLEQEVRSLLARGYSPDLGPMRSLGYKEMVRFIGGELTYSDMLAEVKQNTRRYAKRQQTWFNADKSIEWIDVSALSSAEVAGQIMKRLESSSVNVTNV